MAGALEPGIVCDVAPDEDEEKIEGVAAAGAEELDGVSIGGVVAPAVAEVGELGPNAPTAGCTEADGLLAGAWAQEERGGPETVFVIPPKPLSVALLDPDAGAVGAAKAAALVAVVLASPGDGGVTST